MNFGVLVVHSGGDEQVVGPMSGDHEEVDVGQWLRAIRRRRQISQRDLAGMAGVPTSTVSRIEAGRQNPSVRSFGALVAAGGYRLALVDDKDRLIAVDEEHDRIRDRGGRRFPAHLPWGGKPDYATGTPTWWGWHRIAWYHSDDPAVPDHVYWNRGRQSYTDLHHTRMDAT